MTQYKIQVGSWTKLPDGKVQEDTRDIMEMMGKACGINVETYVPTTEDNWAYIGALESFNSVFSVIRGASHISLYDITDVSSDTQVMVHKPSLFIPYEELQKMLNAPAVSTVQNVPSLLNTKLDCRKADGTVDEELSRAFQEACFEQGIVWPISKDNVSHLNAEFLYADTDQYLCMGGGEDYFNNSRRKQINFTYSRTLNWEATVVEPEVPTKVEEKIITICGVEYTEEQLDNIFKAIKENYK